MGLTNLSQRGNQQQQQQHARASDNEHHEPSTHTIQRSNFSRDRRLPNYFDLPQPVIISTTRLGHLHDVPEIQIFDCGPCEHVEAVKQNRAA
jgi:hypothetical protein